MAMRHNRRAFLLGASSFAFAGLALRATPQGQGPNRTRIILLGTKGGPNVGKSGRSNPSTLILINDVPYVIDCGYGVSRQLISAGISLTRVRYIFITHHHSDHNLEYGPLLYNAWTTPRPPAIDAYGPA